jgi:hypothetical protein
MSRRSLLYVAVCAIGARHAIQRGQTARVLGIRLPGSAAQHAATVGTSLSAPPLMLALLLDADRRKRPRLTRVLAALAIVGILAEADSWTTLRRPRADPTRALIVGAEILLPISMLRGVDGRYGAAWTGPPNG